ncbi:MAG: helix-hairpin-helix domain-containing protein [Candidatus Limnocylindria bacterium]
MTRFDLVTVAAVTAAVVLSGAASLALVAGVALAPAAPPDAADPWASPASSVREGAADGGELVVDIEGGVISPGIHRLPAGSRVADALAAAGGYAEGADLGAAARSLNLAAAVVDGQQIYVPVLGEAQATGGDGAGSGLVNLNRASQSELEALPGIGPVTAKKIIDARAELPFATLDDLVAREVLTARQLEQIADLVTVP